MLNSQTRILETSYDRLKSKSHFQQYRENLAKAGVFRWVTISMNIKDITIPLIILAAIYARHSEHYTNLSTLNHNVRFLPCVAGALAQCNTCTR